MPRLRPCEPRIERKWRNLYRPATQPTVGFRIPCPSCAPPSAPSEGVFVAAPAPPSRGTGGAGSFRRAARGRGRGALGPGRHRDRLPLGLRGHRSASDQARRRGQRPGPVSSCGRPGVASGSGSRAVEAGAAPIPGRPSRREDRQPPGRHGGRFVTTVLRPADRPCAETQVPPVSPADAPASPVPAVEAGLALLSWTVGMARRADEIRRGFNPRNDSVPGGSPGRE